MTKFDWVVDFKFQLIYGNVMHENKWKSLRWTYHCMKMRWQELPPDTVPPSWCWWLELCISSDHVGAGARLILGQQQVPGSRHTCTNPPSSLPHVLPVSCLTCTYQLYLWSKISHRTKFILLLNLGFLILFWLTRHNGIRKENLVLFNETTFGN